jgi:electron transport complex protein RnfE
MRKTLTQFWEGLVTQNPVLVLLLGMCPALAISTTVENGIGMGIAATAVLIGSNFIISILRKLIPAQVRIACYVIIIAGFVTIVELLIKAYYPALDSSLGVFIPLIVVNCMILARVEAFASKNNPFRAVIDGLAMGIGFTAALVIVSSIREILANGTWFGFQVLPSSFEPVAILQLPPGGFITLGVVIAAVQFLLARRKKRPGAGEGSVTV